MYVLTCPSKLTYLILINMVQNKLILNRKVVRNIVLEGI